MLFSYALLRQFIAEERVRSIAAVLGILVPVNVPIVVFSINLLPQSEQLHPQVVAGGGLHDPRFVQALVVSSFAVFLLALWLFLVNIQNRTIEERLLELEREVS